MTDKIENTFATVDATNINAVVAEVSTRLANGVDVDPYEVINLFADTKSNNLELSALFVSRGLLTAQEFKAAITNKKNNEKIYSILGFVPTDVGDFVQKYTERNNIEVLLTGAIKQKRKITHNGIALTDEDLKDPLVRTAYLARTNTINNSTDLKCKMRDLLAKTSLKYTYQQIEDATRLWLLNAIEERKVNMFCDIAYVPQTKACGPIAHQMWKDMEKAAFDTSSTCEGFAVAIIKKFMWQVKRKAVGEPIYNHLMPVITGRQGTGKSTLVNNMLSVIADGVKPATFGDIADPKLIDIWRSPVLFLDEMSGAKKADMTTVKQAITATYLMRRQMRSNDGDSILQQSTFIGCSNDNLSELIRDNTGVRRFAELQFLNKPDWDAMDKIDWKMLWQSVNEFGEDPSIGVMSLLTSQQEDNRNMCSVETWARIDHKIFSKWTRAAIIYKEFSEWENANFKGYNTTLNAFGRKMSALIDRHDDLGWEKQTKGGSVSYRQI